MKKRIFDVVINILAEQESAEGFVSFQGRDWVYMVPSTDGIATFFSFEKKKKYYEMNLEEAIHGLIRGKNALEGRLMVRFENNILTPSDFERPLAEVTYQSASWVEISKETDRPIIEMFTQISKGYWEFSLDEAVEEIVKAKKWLDKF